VIIKIINSKVRLGNELGIILKFSPPKTTTPVSNLPYPYSGIFLFLDGSKKDTGGFVMRKKIVVCEDHSIVIDGLQSLFKDHEKFVLAGFTNKGEDLPALLHQYSPDYLLLDLNLTDTDGFQVLEKIRETNQKLIVLIFTMYQDEFLVDKAKKLGANGYILKQASYEELEEALAQSTHSFYLTHTMRLDMEKKKLFRDSFANKMKLTRRELELIPHMAKGKSSAVLGAELNLSPLTIETHRKNIFRKLQINTTIELVNFAHANNLL
jgi:DNA-binding NarL/FixJ family response regulator